MRFCCFLASAFALFWNVPVMSQDALALGKAIYEARCISCHGVNGAGTPEVPAPIFGDRPTSELAQLITDTMPEGSPEDCVGEEARAVAEWMQKTFYSPEAQAVLNPPAIELSRLTVSQYRNTVADLGTSFRWFQSPKSDRGLKAEYFSSRNHRRDRRIVERIDPVVSYNFGRFSPDGEKISEEEFSIAWSGSIVPRETGLYEFIVRTENGMRLFVNDRRTPLIDAWVRSGPDTEFRATRFLLAGRIYPIRLDWFKFREASASIQLAWKSPNRTEEVIPGSNLIPEGSPEILVVETPFPPDDRSAGYERGTSVSREWDDATTAAAIEVADKVVESVRELAGIGEKDNRSEKIRTFAAQFAERAFRRPLDEETRATYLDAPFASAGSDEEGLRRSVLLILKSPRFLYREVAGLDDQFDRASRLSYALLNSGPDKTLLEAAQNGQLETDKHLRDQAWRLIGDYRVRSRLLEFLRAWMNLERLQDISKESNTFPDFTPELVSDLRHSLELLMEQTVDAENADFRRLLLTDSTFMNGRMARFYGVDLPAGDDFQEVRFEPETRSGIVSHPFLLSGLAYTQTSSPIHRGVFLSRSLLGRGIKPPPIAVAPTAPELAPELTTRERVMAQTSPEVCANCHGLINSLGFSLENFDAVGRYRQQEKNRPIDSSAYYLQRNGKLVRFSGARELAAFLSQSDETSRSFVRQLFHHMVQQPILAWGPDTIQELSDQFQHNEFHMKKIMVEIAVRSAKRGWNTNSGAVVAEGGETRP